MICNIYIYFLSSVIIILLYLFILFIPLLQNRKKKYKLL